MDQHTLQTLQEVGDISLAVTPSLTFAPLVVPLMFDNEFQVRFDGFEMEKCPDCGGSHGFVGVVAAWER